MQAANCTDLSTLIRNMVCPSEPSLALASFFYKYLGCKMVSMAIPANPYL